MDGHDGYDHCGICFSVSAIHISIYYMEMLVEWGSLISQRGGAVSRWWERGVVGAALVEADMALAGTR